MIHLLINFFIVIILSSFTSDVNAQFRLTYIAKNSFILQNYKTDNPIYDLGNHFSYSPELVIGLQGADIAIFSFGIQYHFMGGKNSSNQKLGANYLLFPLSTTFIWKISDTRWNAYLDAGLQYGYQLASQTGENKGFSYEFHSHYWGLHLSPGLEYTLNSKFRFIFQGYYTLQINDASKNFFIGKFHNYGIKLGIRYLKEKSI